MGGQMVDCPSCASKILIPGVENIAPQKSDSFKKHPKKRPTKRATPAKKKASLIKPAILFIISAAAIAGAVDYKLAHDEKMKIEKSEQSEQYAEQQLLQTEIDKRDDHIKSDWYKALALYQPALRETGKIADAIGALESFTQNYPDDNRVATAVNHINTLNSIQSKQHSRQVSKLNNSKIDIMNGLIKEAQDLINKKQYVQAYDLFKNYTGQLRDETKVQRQEQMARLQTLTNSQMKRTRLTKTKKQKGMLVELTKQIIMSKSLNALKAIDTPEFRDINPELALLIESYKDNGSNLVSYFQKHAGKSTQLTISGHKKIVKIIDADMKQLTVVQLINNKKLQSKIKYKYLGTRDKVNAIQASSPTAGALYGLMSSLRKGDVKSARIYAESTGPLADGFGQQL